jgi:general stress protein 26
MIAGLPSRAPVAALIRRIRVGLLTTVDHERRFHTRPLETMEVAPDLTLWFFTDWNSPKVSEIETDIRVSVGYADSSTNSYVAASGTGQLLRDSSKARQLWRSEQRAYYPRGPEDERLALLRIQVERVECWIAPGRLSHLVAAARAFLSGKPAQIVGEYFKLE